ncbi:MAG: hypothetical protein AAGE52_24855 [Myxococcota bacterium]
MSAVDEASLSRPVFAARTASYHSTLSVEEVQRRLANAAADPEVASACAVLTDRGFELPFSGDAFGAVLHGRLKPTWNGTRIDVHVDVASFARDFATLVRGVIAFFGALFLGYLLTRSDPNLPAAVATAAALTLLLGAFCALFSRVTKPERVENQHRAEELLDYLGATPVDR